MSFFDTMLEGVETMASWAIFAPTGTVSDPVWRTITWKNIILMSE